MNKIKKILEKLHQNKDLRNRCVPLFLGNPGLGKTMLIQEFAEEKKLNLIEIIASQLMPHEISGIAIPDQKTKLMSYFDFDKLLSLKDGDIVLFDELLNANSMVLNAMLTLIENRKMISGKKLPNLIFVAAANPQGATMLTPQIKQRFIWYTVKFDPLMWGNYIYKKYNLTDDIIDNLIKLIQNESFLSSDYNYITPRSVDKIIDMAINRMPIPFAYNISIKKLLDKFIENISEKDININGNYIFKPNEKLTWLQIKQYENDKTTSK